MGADPHTFAGLAGMGDLVATCSSPLSRNHTFGMNLGRGMSLAETVAATKQTAEGVKSCESVLDLAGRHGVEMPITRTVFEVVHEGKPLGVAVKELMGRSAKPER
jgi:glycerol-3-phosphate dehydrogenase (NAD(P)+)